MMAVAASRGHNHKRLARVWHGSSELDYWFNIYFLSLEAKCGNYIRPNVWHGNTNVAQMFR